MGIKRFFDKTATISRLTTVSGSRKTFTTTATVDGAFQEQTPDMRSEKDSVQDREWIFYYDILRDESIREGDKVQFPAISNIVYKVKEKTRKDYGINQHVEAILVEYSKE